MTGGSFQAACDTTGNLAPAQTRVLSTAENGIVKVARIDEGATASSDADDDFDTGNSVGLLSGGSNEVTGQADYMGSGGTPIIDANYSTEQGNDVEQGPSPLDVGADCAIWGIAGHA